MADHSELVSEMALLEKMSTQDRLKMARKRRLQQLKKWNQREKEYANRGKKRSDILSSRAFKKSSASTTTTSSSTSSHNKKPQDYKVHFVPSVMLLEAAARSDIDEVRRLLLLGVSPDSANEDGLTALHQCCIDDSEDMMKLLIDFAANVNARDTEQWTPLHAAATCGHLHLVKYLIGKGADLLAVNADGNMPYDICEDETTLDYIESEMAKKGITQQMIDETRAVTELQMLQDLKMIATQQGDFEYRDVNGVTPLHIAAANGYVSVVEFLLDQHVSTDVTDNDSWQPVHAAACWGHPDVLDLLVQAGADLSARTKNGETPIDICEDPELKERIMQLQSEMESKRGSLTNKLKRTHSSNTRSQSIRRTSIREKNQISRREAREEGRILRQEAIEVSPVPESSSSHPPDDAKSSQIVTQVIVISSEEEEDGAPLSITRKTGPISKCDDNDADVVDAITDRVMNDVRILPNGITAGRTSQEIESQHPHCSRSRGEGKPSASCNGSPIKDMDPSSTSTTTPTTTSCNNRKGTWSKKSIAATSTPTILAPSSAGDLCSDQPHRLQQNRSPASHEDQSSIHSSSSSTPSLHVRPSSISTVNPNAAAAHGRVNAVSPMMSCAAESAGTRAAAAAATAAVLIENNNTIKSNGRTGTTKRLTTAATAGVHEVNPCLYVTSSDKRDHVDQIDPLSSHPLSASSSPASSVQHQNLVHRTSSRESVKVEIHVTVNTTSPSSIVSSNGISGIMNKTPTGSSAAPSAAVAAAPLIASQSTSLPSCTAAATGSGIQVVQQAPPSSTTPTSVLPSGTTLSDLKKHRSIARRSAGSIPLIPSSPHPKSSVHVQSQQQQPHFHHSLYGDHQASQLSRACVHPDGLNGKESAVDADLRGQREPVSWMHHPGSPNNNTIPSNYVGNDTPVSASCQPPSYDQPSFPPHLDLSPHEHAASDLSAGAPASPTSVLKKFRSDPSEVYGGGSSRSSSKRGCCIIS